MSDAAGGSPWVSRWRAAYDVALGVVLFLVLLVPAIRQASTGTSAGLRNAMLLLALDLVVLVLLSRYVTKPDRQHLLARRSEPARGAVGADLFDERGAPSPDLGLVFGEQELAVRQGVGPHAPFARLAWSDCAAVVASEVDPLNGPAMVVLQFVAVREDRIRLVGGLGRTRGAGRLLGVSEAAGAMVWVVPAEYVGLVPPLLDYVGRQHPHVRLVHPD